MAAKTSKNDSTKKPSVKKAKTKPATEQLPLSNTYNSFNLPLGNGFLYTLLAVAFLPTIVAPLFTVYGYSPDLHMAWLIQQGATVLLAWYFFSHFNKPYISFTPSALMVAVLAFYGWAFLSLIWAFNRFESMIALLDWGAGVILFLIALNTLRTAKKTRQLIIAIWMTALVLSILGCFQWLFDVQWVQQHAKPSATFNNKNMAAQYCLMSIGLGLGLLWSSTNKLEIWGYAIGTSIIALFVFYTNTRGASIATLGMLLLMGLFLIIDLLLKRKGPMGKQRWGAGATALIGFVILAMFDSNGFRGSEIFSQQVARVSSVATNELNPETQQRGHRLDIWSNTTALIEDHPIIGVGMGNWMVFYPKYQTSKAIDREMSESIQHINTHNDYLEIFADLGLIGMLLLLGIFITAAYLALRNFYTNTSNPNRYLLLGVLLACVGISINAIGSFPFKQPAPIMLVCLFLAVIAAEQARLQNTQLWLFKAKPVAIIGGFLGLFMTTSVFALHYQWNQSEIYFRLATISSHRQNHHDMMRYGKLSHQHMPLRDRMLNFVGMGYLRTGNPEKAAEFLEMVKQSYPYRNNTLQNLGYIYLELAERARKRNDVGHYIESLDKAKTNFITLIDIRSDNVRAMSNLGITYYRLAASQRGNQRFATLQKAVDWLKRSHQQAPEQQKQVFSQYFRLANTLQQQIDNHQASQQAATKASTETIKP